MIKKVTYTFLNTLLFDNKWRMKLWNVIRSRITHFSFIRIPLPAGWLPANGEERPKWPNASFLMVFLSAWNSLTSGAACLWPEHFNRKMCFYSWAPFFYPGQFKKIIIIQFRLHLSSDCGQNERSESSSLLKSRSTLDASLICSLSTKQDLNRCHAFGMSHSNVGGEDVVGICASGSLPERSSSTGWILTASVQAPSSSQHLLGPGGCSLCLSLWTHRW